MNIDLLTRNNLKGYQNEFLKIKLKNRTDFIYGKKFSAGLFQPPGLTPFIPVFPVGFNRFELETSKEKSVEYILIDEIDVESIDVVRQ
ncbi:MAG: hypothetical protein O9353_00915 [Bacteroidia bacterium]|nr:hypothetical protein [Bacteroidia bacterium]